MCVVNENQRLNFEKKSVQVCDLYLEQNFLASVL